MSKDYRDNSDNSMMPPLLTSKLYHSSRGSINSLDPISPSTPRSSLPEYGSPHSCNASFSSIGQGSYPDSTQLEPRCCQLDGYARPPQAPLPRFPGTLPAPQEVLLHERHYLDTPPVGATVTASGTKRYHCRYADALGCEITFATSGHASRHF